VNDTSPDVAARLDALMAKRSGSDRVRMACDMFALARALAVAGIRTADPGVSDVALRVKLFERFYWDDFSPEERDRIVESLR
jgi:hypothetical protein